MARQIRARVGDDKLGALSRANSSNLKQSLARAAKEHAPLKASRAVDFASEVQEAQGPGRRGKRHGVQYARAADVRLLRLLPLGRQPAGPGPPAG